MWMFDGLTLCKSKLDLQEGGVKEEEILLPPLPGGGDGDAGAAATERPV